LRPRRIVFEQFEARTLLAAIITVNSTNDGDTRDGLLSLREAIEVNNRTLAVSSLTAQEQAQVSGTPTADDADTIAFNIPGQGVQTISPTSELPIITDPVTIDGFTQPGAKPNTNAIDDADSSKRGFNGTLLVELSGSGVYDTLFASGLTIDAKNCAVRGLIINRYRQSALDIRGGGTIVEGNLIGTDPTGQTAIANGYGVLVESPNNQIGGTQPASRNVISGNVWGVGLSLPFYSQESAAGSVIAGNFIGTDASGTKGLGNILDGIISSGHVGNSTIGGALTAARNVISSNGSLNTPGDGIRLDTSDGNTIQGNYIGTDVSGAHALGNFGNGISILGLSHENQIGGTTPPERNVISANAIGISLSANATIVQGNLIGTDATGLLPLGNSLDGISLTSAFENQIGGTDASAGNRVGFNGGNGISINSGYRNSILNNSFLNNAGIGIDLGDDGMTANGPYGTDSDPNHLQNYPVLIAAQLLNDGRLSLAYGVPFPFGGQVQFFKADSDGQEGQTLIGEDQYDDNQVGTGAQIILTPLTPLVPGDKIVATATGGDDTSEFSFPITIRAPGCSTLVVNTSDSGAGSLRDAITCANDTAGLDLIGFDIPGTGIHTITALTALPTITDPIFIDGYTQPRSAANTDKNSPFNPYPFTGLSGNLLIQLSGSPNLASDSSGLTLTADGSLVRGLIINGFTGSGIDILGSDNNIIAGNYIGTNASGTAAAANGNWGVLIEAGASGNLVGTDGDGSFDPAERNLISGNDFSGVGIVGADTNNNVVAGNFIGTDHMGTVAVGNGNRGIGIYKGAQGNLVGTNADGVADEAERNIISGNNWEGVGIYNVDTTNNVVAGNWIGLDITGSRGLPNLKSGIAIFDQANLNIVGGTTSAAANYIAANAGDGVTILNAGTINNAILGNSIFSNGDIGIDLGPASSTPNDDTDADTGANNLQNFPLISYVTRDSGQIKITYTVPADPANSTYPLRVEFFRTDDAGLEGEIFLGFDTFTSSDFAAGGKTVLLPTGFLAHVSDKIVATATDSLPAAAGSGPANTSEFSPASTVVSPWQNPGKLRWDVNDDKSVSATDVLDIINYINAKSSGAVPDDAANQQPYCDVDGDNYVVAEDVVTIINYIDAGRPMGGEAEAAQQWQGEAVAAGRHMPTAEPLVGDSSVANGQSSSSVDVLALLAADVAAQSLRKRRI
jgi:hypothetical protein